MSAQEEFISHFMQAFRESQPLADVILPGTVDFRSQVANELGMRYAFGPGALAYTERALKEYVGAAPDARALVERHKDGLTIVIYWSES